MASLLLNKNGKIITNEEGKPYKINGASGDFDGKKIILKDEDNGFVIILDAESGEILFTNTGSGAEFYVTPYILSINNAGNFIDLNLEDGITYRDGEKYVTLSTNLIFTQKEGEPIKDFYFPNKSGTLALEEQMQEMIVDIVWENEEAFVELGNNVIDWSRPVFFKLFKENSGFYVTLEWKYSYGSGGSIVDPLVDCNLNYVTDFGSIFNGCWFISGGSKAGVDRELTSQHDPSYILFATVIEDISDFNKMKVYYYPVNEYSPSVNVEI